MTFQRNLFYQNTNHYRQLRIFRNTEMFPQYVRIQNIEFDKIGESYKHSEIHI